MPKALNFHLTEAGLREIVEAIKHDKRPEVRQRAMGLRLLDEGKSPKEVAEFLAVSQPTVYDWHHRWQKQGLEGLANRPKPGRPVKATDSYIAELEEAVEQEPQDLGYAFSIWTTERLRLHLKTRTGIELKPTQFKALLKENDFVYRRPKHDLGNLQDEKARQAAEEWLEEPKKAKSTSSLWTKAR